MPSGPGALSGIRSIIFKNWSNDNSQRISGGTSWTNGSKHLKASRETATFLCTWPQYLASS
eukprot:1977988-Pyramimonas_sp.AAC.1